MILTIADILDADALLSLTEDLKSVRWIDGSLTAGHMAQSVKRNSQADLTGRTGVAIRDRLNAVLQTHPVLCAASQPARFSKILISRTENEGGYGRHIDNPFMDYGDRVLRTDLSYTLFLNDPDDYDGGALIIDRLSSTKHYKLPQGSLVLYPSSFLHAVEPVTRGVRLACVGWIESRVKDVARREILFDLENLAASLSHSHDAQSAERLTLAKAIANLKRDFS